MINMIQNAKDQAAALAMNAYKAAVADGSLPEAEVKTAPVEIPKDTANGDFTTTFALAASKALRQPPATLPRPCWITWIWRVPISPPLRSQAPVF